MITFKEKSSKPEEIIFKHMNVTDTFFVKGIGMSEIFMRVNDVDFNAVSLKFGILYNFLYDEQVQPVDLVIEYSVRNETLR